MNLLIINMCAIYVDLRYAARMLRRDPAFATVAIVSLAIGIGASTAAFSVFNVVMLRPLPVSDPDRLVLLKPERRGDEFILVNPIYEELRARQTTLSGMFAANDPSHLKVTFEDETAPAYLRASLVSGSYFAVLGLTPHMGRLLAEQDDQLPAASSDDRCAAVISYRLWVRRFELNPAAIGRTLRVRDSTCAIVGIAPATFETHQTGFTPDIWLPLRPFTDRKLLASYGMAFFCRRDGPPGAGGGGRAGRGGGHDSLPAGAGRSTETARLCRSATDDAG